MEDPNAFYCPCVATPTNWYDEAAAQNWPTIVIRSAEVKPAAADTSPFVKAGGLALQPGRLEKLKADARQRGPIKANIQQGI